MKIRARGRAVRCAATLLVLFCGGFITAQTGRPYGSLRVHVNVQPSILLTASDATGNRLSQGGEASAALTMTFLPGRASFQTRALVANNPTSSGFTLVARLVSAASSVELDGAPLTLGQDVVIGSNFTYRELAQHTLTLTSDGPVSVILIAKPN